MFYLSENALHNGIFLSFPNDPHLAVIRSVIAFYQRKTLSVLIIWLKRTTLFNPVVKLHCSCKNALTESSAWKL